MRAMTSLFAALLLTFAAAGCSRDEPAQDSAAPMDETAGNAAMAESENQGTTTNFEETAPPPTEE